MPNNNNESEKKKIYLIDSKNIIVKLIGFIYYFLGFLLILDLFTTWEIQFTLKDTILDKISSFIAVIIWFSPFLLLSDFSKKLREKIPLLNRNSKICTILFFIITIIFLITVSESIMQPLHTEEYSESKRIEQEQRAAEEKAKQEQIEAEKKAQKEKKELEEKKRIEEQQIAKQQQHEQQEAERMKKEQEEKVAREQAEEEKRIAEQKAEEERKKQEQQHKEYIEQQKKLGKENFIEIKKAYGVNSLSADDKYKGNTYTLYGELSTIKDDGIVNKLLDSIGVTMVFRDGTSINYAFCYFKADQRDKLATYQKGEYILFQGECSSWGNWSNCEIIE